MTQDYKRHRISKLSILFLVIRIVGFCCVGLILFEEMDIGINAHEMQLTFFLLQEFRCV